jgi:hypothetical protein
MRKVERERGTKERRQILKSRYKIRNKVREIRKGWRKEIWEREIWGERGGEFVTLPFQRKKSSQ